MVFCRESYQTTQMEATFWILTPIWIVFARNPTRPCKSKQTFQFYLFFNCFCKKSYQTRKSKESFQFWPIFECFFRKLYWNREIQATFPILIRFWMVFARNPTRLRFANRSNRFNFDRFWMNGSWRKPTKPLNRGKLFNFDPFLNGFCKKSY